MRIVYSHEGHEKVFESATAEIVIGRAQENERAAAGLDLAPDRTVSRPHARISVSTGAQYWIEDVGSKRGTQLNGEEIKGKAKQILRQGDVLKIGETTLRIEALDSAIDPNSTLPPDVPDSGTIVEAGNTLDAEVPAFVPADASRSAEQLSLLFELPLQFASATGLDNLLQNIVERLISVIPGAARGAVLLKDRDSGRLVLKAHLPVGEPAVSMTWANRAMNERKTLRWKRDEANVPGSAVQHSIRTGMYAPLIWRESVLGVICVDNPDRETAFDDEDQRLLVAVAQYAAMAVEHTRMIGDLRRNAELISRLLGSRFPPRVRENLMRAAAADSLPLGTRRSHVTVLISDIRGFTQLTARLGPPRMSDLLNDYFPALIEAIHAHGGTIERFVGDAIFAVFGSPEPDDDQHLTAVKAAVGMQSAAADMTKARLRRNLETCEFGIGVHCSEMLHGFIGNAERMEFAVLGDAANFASRYCNGAGPGEILISPDVHGHVFNRLKTEPVEIPTKHEGNLRAFRVKGLLG